MADEHDPTLTGRPIRGRYTPRARRAHIEGDESFTNKRGKVPNLDELCPTTDGAYDPRLAYALSVISAWSYSDGQTLANKLEWYGMPKNVVHEFTIVNAALLVASKAFFVRSERGRVGVLSFTGTEPDSVVDLLTDANVCFKSFGDDDDRQAIHTGFFDSVEVLWGDISERLELARCPDLDGDRPASEPMPEPLQALYVTGHSLGGAMAVLAAVTILEKSPTWDPLLRGVYTYGQPAVGNADFAARSAEVLESHRYFRHVYASDVVPHLPPTDCGDFYHFGTELRWDDDTSTWNDPAPKAKVVRQVQSRIAAAAPIVGVSFFARRMPVVASLTEWWPFTSYSIDDHFPANYMDKCRAALSGNGAKAEAKPTPSRAA